MCHLTNPPDAPTPDEIDDENPLVQSMMFTELVRELEECDSKRVDDFWDELQNSVLEIVNPKDL